MKQVLKTLSDLSVAGQDIPLTGPVLKKNPAKKNLDSSGSSEEEKRPLGKQEFKPRAQDQT